MATKKHAGSAAWIDPEDAPALTEAMLAEAEVFEGDRFVHRGRGRPKSGVAREQISVRLDPDVLAALRAAGPGWQSRINALLRQGLALDDTPARRVAPGVVPRRPTRVPPPAKRLHAKRG
jgi:uncharacterized protein (DUF4415 family)